MSDEGLLLADAAGAVEVARSLGADDAVASLGEGRSTEYVLRDGRMEKVQESASRVLSVQLYVDGRYSAHRSNDLRPAVLRAFLRDAIELTRALEPDPYRRIADPALYAGRSDADLDLVDPALVAFERERALAALAAIDGAAHGDPRVISASSTLQVSASRSARASSNGFRGTDAGTGLAYVCEVSLDEGNGRRPEAYAYAQATHLEDLPEPVRIGQLALERAVARMGSSKGRSQRTVAVIDREPAASLLARACGALSAASVQQKRSFLAGKLGEPIAAPLLSVSDEPLLRRGLGSQHYDSEGISARSRSVIEDGVLRTYYVDTYYGRKLGWQPTTGSPSNVVVAPGRHSLEELLADVAEGIYVTGWAGGNADGTTGDFSFGLQGRRIEGGRLGAPLGEMNVTGNYLELLRSLREVGNDPFPYSTFRVPTLVFDQVQFSGT